MSRGRVADRAKEKGPTDVGPFVFRLPGDPYLVVYSAWAPRMFFF